MDNEEVALAGIGGPRRPNQRFKNRTLLKPGILLPCLFLITLLSSILASQLIWKLDYKLITETINAPPSGEYPLGTDLLGRDMLARTLEAAGQSLLIALVVTVIGMVVGGVIGIVSGYFGGFIDTLLMRTTDLAMTIPLIALAGFLANLNMDLPGPAWLHMGLILSIVIWTLPARLLRGVTLSIRNEDFIEVARSYGISPFRILATHVLPNVASQILVTASIMLAVAILAESGLSFIGLGVQPPGVSLGVLVAQGQASAFTSPWLFYPAGLLIVGIALSANFLSDTLREVIDPRSKEVGAVGLTRVKNISAELRSSREGGVNQTINGELLGGKLESPRDSVLVVEGLSVNLANGSSLLRDVSFALARGETIAIVGESGAGKSTLANALVGALPRNLTTSGNALLGKDQLLGRSFNGFRSIRGARIGFIQQDPMTFLNPTMRVGPQLKEAMGRDGASRDWNEHICKLLAQVGIRDPERRMRAYPHELSGGMKQRVGIVMALLREPEVVIADEPTTALDATVQADVVSVLKERVKAVGASLIFVTHNLGLVAGLADRVIVMYGGQVVEVGAVEDIFHRPLMPYTAALLRSVPRIDAIGEALEPIPGKSQGGSVLLAESGCSFAERCPRRFDKCEVAPPLFDVGNGRRSACWISEPDSNGRGSRTILSDGLDVSA